LNNSDTAFMIISTALVFLMIPGLAFFYGGLVKKRHVLSIMMQSIATIGIISILWIIVGYSLAFGPDVGNIIGNLDYVGLRGVSLDPKTEGSTIPHMLFMLYQMMFAIITPAIMTGSTAERLRFPAYFLIICLWSLMVYAPLAHWVWGGGWLADLGVLDFAGGTVVHISSGFSGLIAALVIGGRKNRKTEKAIPHNLPYVVLGAGLLWFGWFGFNGGSQLAADGIAVLAMTTTHISACAGLLGWILIEKLLHGRPTVLGAVSGLVAGLGAITPACAFVSPLTAIVIGLASSGLCYFAVAYLKEKLGYDDALDAFGIHGIAGTWGTLAVGLFASAALNPNGTDGLLQSGSFGQAGIQLVAILATFAWSGIVTFLILKVVGLVTPLTASDDEQESGLDITQHGESAYPDVEGMAPDTAWNMFHNG